MNATNPKEIRVVWWNPYDLYHFNPSKTKKTGDPTRSRWPKNPVDYAEKLNRVCTALTELKSIVGEIDVLCLCETTNDAAEDLRKRIFPNHRLFSLDFLPQTPSAQIAVIFPKSSANLIFEESHPISVPNLSKDSRSMGVLEIKIGKKVIQIIACHWTARMSKDSETLRERAGDHLGMYCYDFIKKDEENHHIIVLGDLNDEPFDKSLGRLNTHRFRSRSRSAMHYADHYVKRLHLYNASWRLLGEKHGHINKISSSFLDCAGTYYSADYKQWYNFDQIIVSGNLLDSSKPFVNEDEIHIASSPAFLTKGLPLQFEKTKAGYSGLSDHLPITFTISI